MSKEALISGGFEYSEMHDSYRNLPNTPYKRLELPSFYVSKVTEKKYSFEEYSPHGFGSFKKGYKDLPTDEYPFTVEYRNIIQPILSLSK